MSMIALLFSLLISSPLSAGPVASATHTHETNSGITLDQATVEAIWGWDAHKMVCMIAWWEMEESTRSRIKTMLGDDSEYDRFMESCLWADDVRGRLEQYDRWSTAHYVNLPRDADAFIIERDCADTFCVVEGIIESRDVLSDPDQSDARRLDALKFLSHFIGDIHQPLHAGYADDRGGNDTRVVLFDQETNLHSAWDWGLIAHSGLDWMQYASHLYFEISSRDRSEWASDDPASWSKESYDIVRDSAYDIGDGEIGQEYYDRHISLIELRIKQAGVRLADQLDRILGS